jgi:glutamine synthetase
MTQQDHAASGSVTPSQLETEHSTIFIGFCDVHGLLRGKQIPSEMLDHTERSGIALYGGVCLLGHANMLLPFDGLPTFSEGVTSDVGDMRVKPILSTRRPHPWNRSQSWCIGDTEATSTWSELSSRSCLERVICHYHAQGLTPVAALEREFYLLQQDQHGQWAPYGNSCPSTVYTPGDPLGYIEEMLAAASLMHLGVRAWTREFDCGQFEINLDHGDAMDAADRDTYFRHMVKSTAERRHLRATFMGRPRGDWGGSGCHVHLSLANEARENIFAASPEEHSHLSQQARYFLAGVLSHAPALLALLCPTINAYRRLQPNGLVPTAVTWGIDDRKAFVRVPKEDGPDTRLEIRAPDGAANPYLSLAALLWAGWDGLQGKMEPPPETGVDSASAQQKPLPRTLEESLDALERDSWLSERLGPLLVKVFCGLKRQEVEHFRFLVSSEEQEFYQLL